MYYLGCLEDMAIYLLKIEIWVSDDNYKRK